MVKGRIIFSLQLTLLGLPAVALLLLAGCTLAPASTPAAATADPSVTQSVPPAQPPTLPWEEPELEYFTYEEYFGQVRPYDPMEDLTYSFVQEGYQLREKDGTLLLTRRDTGETLWEICSLEGLEIVLADPTWLYAIRDGRELIRMDYWGDNTQRLFWDGSGLISRMNLLSYENPLAQAAEFGGDGTRHRGVIQRRFCLADGRVLYFWAGTESGDGATLYRMYLPERRVDALFQYTQEELDGQYRYPDLPELEGKGPFYRISAPQPASNQEVSWSTGNPDLLRQLGPQPSYQQLSDPDLLAEAELTYQTPSRIQWRLNTATGSYRQTLTGQYDWS